MLDRRQLLSGAGALAFAELVPSVVSAADPEAGRRIVINAIAGYANLAKHFVFNSDPGNQDANGYPIKTPATNMGANPSMPEGYFGDFVWKFRGRGSMQFSPGALIRSGGQNIVGVSGNTGETNYNTTILDKTNPRVVLTFGANILNMSPSPVDNGAGGRRVRLTFKPGFANSASPVIKVQALAGRGQASAAGIWKSVRVDPNTVDLVANALTGEPAAWNPNDPYRGPGGEAIWQATNIAVYILAQGTFSGFSNLVFCKAENETLVDSGALVDPLLIEQMRHLRPSWLRFMDLTGVQASYESEFARRVPAASLFYPGPGGRFVPDYWVGSIKRGPEDAYTCVSRSGPSAGPYRDNEVVQGVLDLPNKGINPTLNVDGRGAKYIYGFGAQCRILRLSGTIPAPGSKFEFRFSAPWLNGGKPYDASYVVGSRRRYQDSSFAGIKANLMDLFAADPILTGKVAVWNSGDLSFFPITPHMGALSIDYLSGPAGTFCRIGRLDPYAFAAGQNRIRMRFAGNVSNAEILSLTFNRADLPGGSYTLSYETRIGTDKSLQVLCASLNQAINNDTVLKQAGISAFPFGLPPNTLDIQQADTWAGEGLSLSLRSTGAVSATFGEGGATGTFIYSYLLDGWIWRPGGMLQSIPFEYMVELCNATGAGCWVNWPINTNAQFITDVTNYFRDNLKPNVNFGTEVGNEMWNFGQSPWGRAMAKGFCLGFASGSNNPNYSITALRTKQYGDLTIAAWTAKRPRAQLYLFNQSATWDLGNTNMFQFKGGSLDAAANRIYAAHGGLGGGPAPSYNAAPNRPIDICDAIGVAPYWGSPWIAGDVNYIKGAAFENAPLLQAAKDHAAGNVDAAYTALSAQIYGAVKRSSPGAGGITFEHYKTKVYPQLEQIAASFDAGRSRKMAVIHYEGGPQFGVGNINNGTNDPVTDVPGLTARIKSLGWNVSAYTVSGRDDATEMASQIVDMIYRYKFSPQYKALYKQGFADVVAAHPGREAAGAQYGYERSQWGLFPRGYGAEHYSSYDAIHEFNRGG
ncbi:hypothetical protein [Bradyrhizobium sp. BTAi1]|uniref:hypothetical protein n=1 Tax=Bradyrhizobium sp. (strain BTAi1 / ATCC BAA-1182) TaxID=288000 RepID=UPI00005DC7FA|nr:hypothetical protein [Bradyrhizobium sp. BTAi1]ABQ33250.1 putative exported protein of unknown function [Bradyrhizobium sp. BTAi1]